MYTHYFTTIILEESAVFKRPGEHWKRHGFTSKNRHNQGQFRQLQSFKDNVLGTLSSRTGHRLPSVSEGMLPASAKLAPSCKSSAHKHMKIPL